MSDKKIKVLIVDDSPVACQLLRFIVESDPALRVMDCLINGKEAVRYLEGARPDVVVMDINMPIMNGYEATRLIMAKKPIPIVICSSDYHPGDIGTSFLAMEAGALAILEKPVGVHAPSFGKITKEFIETVKTISEVKLVSRFTGQKLAESSPLVLKEKIPKKNLQNIKLVAIGASLGGPQALSEVLSKLKKDFPVPIIVVQHIVSGFTQGFVSWLNTISTLPLKQASHQEQLTAGVVYVAPSDKQIEVDARGAVKLVHNTANEALNPSISHLFHSVAETYHSQSIGIILTGMGRDGVAELGEMKRAGAVTIAQAEANCLMFGMPKEAIQAGAATHVLSLEGIIQLLNQL